MYLRNHWYVAAYSSEVSRKPLGRVMLGEPVVLYRKEDGSVVALEDRCAHRRLPLSMGTVIGDDLQCHYHSVVFDCTGACVKIPGQERIPRKMKVKSYPVVDRSPVVFVWMGDEKDADETLIPTHFDMLNQDGWANSTIHCHVESNYQLVIDNLLDLSHLATVHASTVGTAHVADMADVETERNGDQVTVSRWTMDVPAASTYQQFGDYKGNIDRWQVSEFFPPSYFRINNGSATVGTGARDGKGDNRWDFWVCHGITPESPTTTHYYWALAHKKWPGKKKKDIEEFHRQCHHVIGEDIEVFIEQQKCINLDPASSQVDILYDAGPLAARRIIDKLLKKEAVGRKKKGKAGRKAA
jgi:phenylpropionate dioxygenase-like ring-hydroxylating dioxygenase large terminal subunit